MANETDSELLALARTALARRLAGDAYDEYSEADRRFRGLDTDKLYDLVIKMEIRIAASSAANRYQLVRPTNL